MSGRAATVNVIPGKYALSVGRADMMAPPGWVWVPLQEVARLESGHTPSRQHAHYWDGGIPWIGIKDAREHHGGVITHTAQTVTQDGLDNSAARLLPRATVCLSRTASVGYVVVMGQEMATSQDFVNWICGPALDPHFLKLLFIAEHESLFQFGKGTTHTTIYFPEVKAFHVCLPSLAKQRRIVAKVEDLTTQSRRAKEALDAVPPLLDKLRQSILAAAFRGDLTADWRAKHPDLARRDDREISVALLTDLPKRKKAARARTETDALAARRAPSEWRMVRLFEVAEVQLGQRRAPEYAGATEYPYIRAANIKWDGLDLGDVKSMGFADPEPLLLAPGDVLLTEASGSATEVGKPAIWRGELANCCFQATVLRLRANNLVLPEWLYYSILADARLGRFAAMAPGVGILHLTSGRMREWPVSLPTLSEQQVICTLLRTALASIHDREAQLATLKVAVARLDASVLAAAFRGELVPQDPADEPASVLLDRIRAARASVETGAGPRRRSRKAEAVAEEPDESDADGGSDAPASPLRSVPVRTPTKSIGELNQDAILEEVFAALWTRGPLEKDDAVRKVAERLREAGHVEFQRLRGDGPLYGQVLKAIDAAVKAGVLDRPKRGYVRACKPDATAYTAEDWRLALVTSLGAEPTDRDDAIREAAEWARDNLGLEFARLRSDGRIVEGLRSAINSAIRRGEVTRLDARRIERPHNEHDDDSTAETATDNDAIPVRIEHVAAPRHIDGNESVLVLQLPSVGRDFEIQRHVAQALGLALSATVAQRRPGGWTFYLGLNCPHVEGLSTWVGVERRVPAGFVDLLEKLLSSSGHRVHREYATVARHRLHPFISATDEAIEVPPKGPTSPDDRDLAYFETRKVIRRPFLVGGAKATKGTQLANLFFGSGGETDV